jgi:DNA-binding response OmpR family regulator
MTWLNDKLSPNPHHCGEFAFYGVLPSVWVDEATARLTPDQAAILEHLKARAPATVSGFELRDAVCPKSSEGSIRVQVHRMRQKGIKIESQAGPHGGYRVEASA